MRYTEYHAGKAVIKDRSLLPEAMEMCRQEYGKYYSVEGEISPITGVVIQPGIFTCPKVFQFPKDEEVK